MSNFTGARYNMLLRFFVLTILMVVSGVFSEKLKMYLCLDEMISSAGSDSNGLQAKLVYGYIDGKKTECMSEYEFRERFFKEEFARENAVNESSQKIVEKGESFNVNAISGIKNLKSADLRGFDLKGVDLSEADLQNANLESADLRDADLRNANLSGANLEFSYLKGANLSNADLTGANLKNAYLHQSDLSGVKGFDLEQLRITQTVYNAKLEPELLEIAKKECPNRFTDPGSQWKCKYYSRIDSIIPEEKRANRRSFK